ncbi:MAG: penicillin-insensitive murein endopeptidase [Aliidongia sp.]
MARTRAIGSYTHGCLAGGIALPIDGPGYEAIRLQRRRIFGHADMIAYLRKLGEKTVAAGLPRFRVGDVAQARGGPAALWPSQP